MYRTLMWSLIARRSSRLAISIIGHATNRIRTPSEFGRPSAAARRSAVHSITPGRGTTTSDARSITFRGSYHPGKSGSPSDPMSSENSYSGWRRCSSASVSAV